MKKLILFILIFYINLFANQANVTNINNSFLAEKQPEFNQCEVACPNVIEGYFTRLKNVNLSGGRFECFVYRNNNYLSPIATVSTENKHCAKAVEADKVNLNMIDTSAIDLIDNYENKYKANDNKFLNAPKYIVASMTLDSQKIDVKKSIEHNEIKLKNGYHINSGMADITTFYESIMNSISSFFGEDISELESIKNLVNISSIQLFLDDSIMFFIHFLNESNYIFYKLKTFLLVSIFPLVLGFGLMKKSSIAFQKMQDNEDYLEKIGVGIFIIIFFFVSTVKIETNEGNHISQNAFQNSARKIIYEGQEFADMLSIAGTKAYLKSNARDVGISSIEEIKSLTKQQSSLEKEVNLIKPLIEVCHQTFDIKNMRNQVKNIYGSNFNFPPNEQVKFDAGVIGKSSINWYSDEFLIDKRNLKRSNSLSVTSCFNLESDYISKNQELKSISSLLSKYQDNRFNDTLNKQLDIFTKIQLKNAIDLGFLNMPILATSSITLDTIGVFPKAEKNIQNQTQNILKNYRKNQEYEIGDLAENEGLIDNSLNSVLEHIPYLLLPGADSIQMRIANLIKSDENGESDGFVSMILNKASDLIPIGKIADLISNLSKLRNNDFFVTIISGILTILIMMYMISLLPLIAVSTAGFAVIFFYFISIEIFYIFSPLFVAFAFVSNQTEILQKVLKKLLILAIKPILIVVSISISIFAFSFFISINSNLLEMQFEPLFAMTEAMAVNSISTATTYATADFTLIFIKGFLSMTITVVAIIVCFYLVYNGPNLALDMFGVEEANFDSQSVIGDKVESKTGKMNTPTI